MEEKFYRINEINESLKAYFLNHHHHQPLKVSNESQASTNTAFSPTPVPRKKHDINDSGQSSLNSHDKDNLLLSSSSNISNSKSSSLLDDETSSSSVSSAQHHHNDDEDDVDDDSRNLLILNSLPRPHRPPLNDSTRRDTTRTYLMCKSSSNMTSSNRTPTASSTLAQHRANAATMPRKPRRYQNIPKKSVCTADSTASIPPTNLYCFINSSYAVSASPNPVQTSRSVLNTSQSAFSSQVNILDSKRTSFKAF